MGECLISRRGGEAYSLPVLNASYPQDATIIASSSGTVGFSVIISEHGRPVEYTYQWYRNGSMISGATNSTYTYKATTAGTFTFHCEVTNKAGVVTSRIATLTVSDAIPLTYSYNGTSELIKDSAYNWRIKLYSSGTLTLPIDCTIDMFLVGGGGGGATNTDGGGGGGGYTYTLKNTFKCTKNTPYSIVIGGGGSAGGNGGTTTAFNQSAQGGYGSTGNNGGAGGSGGGGFSYCNQNPSAGGNGGSDGSAGAAGGGGSGGSGQGSTTREFGETSGTLYAGGGGGAGGGRYQFGGSWNYGWGGSGGSGGGGNGYSDGHDRRAATAGADRYGGGGGGGWSNYAGAKGGSGIVVIRNAR